MLEHGRITIGGFGYEQSGRSLDFGFNIFFWLFNVVDDCEKIDEVE